MGIQPEVPITGELFRVLDPQEAPRTSGGILKLFLDTAHLAHIRTARDWGVLDGVTTNPTLAAREGLKFHELIARICEISPGPVSAEVVSPEVDGMLAQARELSAIADNVVVKVPMSKEGVAAGARMVEEGIGINVTLVFSVAQAILAARIGATFVSPFLGRVDDAGNDGLGLLRDIVEVFAVQGYETEVLAASLRHPVHVVEAARLGADAATMPFAVMEKLFHHPLTDIGMERFNADWEAYQQALARQRDERPAERTV